jgi:acetyl esterase/lipase
MLRYLVCCLTLPLTLLSTACGSLSFAVVNLPAHFSPASRTSDIAYGTEPWRRLDVYQPPGVRAGSAAPVIIFCYGGNWTSGSRKDYRFVGSALADKGYVTFVPDYGHYPAERFPAFIEDLAAAVSWIQAHATDFGADPKRIVLMGHSAGAHMAAMLALNSNYLRAAGADPARIVGLIGLSGPYDLAPNTPTLHAIFSAPYSEADWQVTRFASDRAPPSLLIHGGDDKLVWPSNSEHLAAELRQHRVPVQLRIYPGIGHAVVVGALSPVLRFRAPTLTDVDAFMKSLALRVPPQR